MSYTGGENATPNNVRQYLADSFGNTEGAELSEQDLDTLMTKYDDTLQRGVRAGSFANYVGDLIADAAALTYTGDDADES